MQLLKTHRCWDTLHVESFGIVVAYVAHKARVVLCSHWNCLPAASKTGQCICAPTENPTQIIGNARDKFREPELSDADIAVRFIASHLAELPGRIRKRLPGGPTQPCLPWSPFRNATIIASYDIKGEKSTLGCEDVI